jgi:hypothetical protein
MTTAKKTRPTPLACSLHTAAAKAHGLSAATYPIHPGDKVTNITGTVGTYRGLWQAGTKRETVEVQWDKVQPGPEIKRALTAVEWAMVLDAVEGHGSALWQTHGASAAHQDGINAKACALDALAEKLGALGVKRC